MSDIDLTYMLREIHGEAKASLSWHETERRELGLPDECDSEPVLSLQLQGNAHDLSTAPMAFIIEPYQARNTVQALGHFLREAFHPVSGHADVLAIVDFMPPLDDLGQASSVSRRWVLDQKNYPLMMANISAYVTIVARGMI